jgi:hypothetical protein
MQSLRFATAAGDPPHMIVMAEKLPLKLDEEPK